MIEYDDSYECYKLVELGEYYKTTILSEQPIIVQVMEIIERSNAIRFVIINKGNTNYKTCIELDRTCVHKDYEFLDTSELLDRTMAKALYE